MSVSHGPIGPAEASILRDLAPVFSVRSVPAGGTVFRVLEGGEGPPLVLVHGRGLACTTWAPWLSPLARSHRVLALDLPGFGATPPGRLRPGGAEEGLEFFVEPVEDLLRELTAPSAAPSAQAASDTLPGAATPPEGSCAHTEFKSSPAAAPPPGSAGTTRSAQAEFRSSSPSEVVLVGHSLGGLVCVELALRRALRPRALVLIGCMGVGPAMSYPARAYFLAGPERVARAGKALYSRISPLPDHAWRRRLDDLQHEIASVPGGRPVPSAAFNRLFPVAGNAFHRLHRLGEIAAPALVVWGERDVVFPAPAALVAAAALPHGRALVFPGLGHSPHLEAPERVLSEVERFLGSLAGRRSEP